MNRSRPAARNRQREDESLESLQQTHQQLEQRLDKLDRQRSLSPEEQFEVQVLKKRKLALKDRIRAIRPGLRS